MLNFLFLNPALPCIIVNVLFCLVGSIKHTVGCMHHAQAQLAQTRHVYTQAHLAKGHLAQAPLAQTHQA